ncbi:Probable L-asparaginase [Acholeplasma oculi]|uniref:asparaginase n=1 Tax=Acholeplasma oculi TaxID=35623 RepID=A0A061ABN7_9MOLU|nr:asparaginase [Acholeplasma oculi]CDR30824.1 L-Asparaginase [Acholeplasma oculi]SKC35149.1 L-asparaginase [Acholeplasma oculi]SUT89841.1 Probable L-asparaginase [Acholeplasma oculi]
MNKKRVLVIFTGGTIAMMNDLNTMRTVMSSGNINLIEQIKDKLLDIEIDYHELTYLPSPYITPEHMFKLAKLIESKISVEKYDGIVITHGTDTIEETAYFLEIYFNIETPIVLTGSMRNISELGYDGFSNIVSSILVAASDDSKTRGVLLVLNDEINSASEVVKTHTVALDTFKSLEFGPLGIVDSKDVIYHRLNTYTKPNIKITKLTKRVEIIKVATGSTSNIINFLIDDKVDGIVLEALGRGNVPPMMLEGIKHAISNGVPVVLTSRCPKGRVFDTYAYEGGGHHLKSLGVLFSGNLPSQKARLLLMMALEQHNNLSDLRKYFD